MKEQPAPLLNPETLKPSKVEELYPVFCEKLAQQEMDSTTRYIDIPEEVQEFYKMYRPSPLIRAYNLEKALGTPAKIYFKFEGNNTGTGYFDMTAYNAFLNGTMSDYIPIYDDLKTGFDQMPLVP